MQDINKTLQIVLITKGFREIHSAFFLQYPFYVVFEAMSYEYISTRAISFSYVLVF